MHALGNLTYLVVVLGIIISMLREDKESGLAKFIGGLIFGLAAGYLTALLLTEKTGPELRKDFVENSNEILENMKDKLDVFRDKAADRIQEIKNFADEKFSLSAIKIQDQIDSIAKQLDELGKKTKEVANESKENTPSS